MMRGCRLAILCVILLLPLVAGRAAAADPGVGEASLSLTGKVRHPQQFDLARLRGLPGQEVKVSFQTEHGVEGAGFDGVPLWTLLGEAGGIDDPEKGAVLRHVLKVTGRDGYVVMLSTGEIAPDFGGKPALIACQRDGEPPGASGFRLVMPGDKKGGRYVRDVVTIDVE